MELKLTQIIEAEECTHEFLNDGKHLANHAWKVAKKKDGTYLIFHKVTYMVIEEFKEKIGADCYTSDAASAADAAVELCK